MHHMLGHIDRGQVGSDRAQTVDSAGQRLSDSDRSILEA